MKSIVVVLLIEKRQIVTVSTAAKTEQTGGTHAASGDALVDVKPPRSLAAVEAYARRHFVVQLAKK